MLRYVNDSNRTIYAFESISVASGEEEDNSLKLTDNKVSDDISTSGAEQLVFNNQTICNQDTKQSTNMILNNLCEDKTVKLGESTVVNWQPNVLNEAGNMKEDSSAMEL